MLGRRAAPGIGEDYTYRYLAAAHAWASTEHALVERLGFAVNNADNSSSVDAIEPSSAEMRAWARSVGLPVSDRGRLRPEIRQAWRDAHPL